MQVARSARPGNPADPLSKQHSQPPLRWPYPQPVRKHWTSGTPGSPPRTGGGAWRKV